MKMILFLAVLLVPLCSGLAMYAVRTKKQMDILLMASLIVTLVCSVGLAAMPAGIIIDIPMAGQHIAFGFDACGRIFGVLFAAIFLLAAVHSMEYMEHDHAPHQYNAFFLFTLFAMMGLSTAQSMLTYYMCYELMTVLSFPLVIHEGTESAKRAGMKYLGYSLFGASVALFGYFVLGSATSTQFVIGGTLQNMTPAVLFACFCLLIGFGCKAGIMPLHFWLPTAHPVAPAPASAVLSATITKAGVLGIIRVIYFVVGPEKLAGTWVQYLMLTLALCTVFSGSMLAFKEKLLKRRFAWSTVSQVSYVLYGIFLLCPDGFHGAMLQVVFHAVCKTALFLTAGAIIHHTGCTRVEQLAGVGRRMPVIMVSYTLASLSLVGIPPFAGFVSKWTLATAGLNAVPGFGVAGAIILLVSAMLTAGYLLPITTNGFFGICEDETRPEHLTWRMNLPIAVMGIALLLMGIFPHGLDSAVSAILAAAGA